MLDEFMGGGGGDGHESDPEVEALAVATRHVIFEDGPVSGVDRVMILARLTGEIVGLLKQQNPDAPPETDGQMLEFIFNEIKLGVVAGYRASLMDQLGIWPKGDRSNEGEQKEHGKEEKDGG